MLEIRINGTLRQCEPKTFEGKTKLAVHVTYDGGSYRGSVKPELQSQFPPIGSPVSIVLTGDLVPGEYGVTVQRVQFVRVGEAKPVAATSGLRAAA